MYRSGNNAPPASADHDNRLARRLRRGGIWTAGGRTAGMAMVLAIHVFLARVMPTDQFAGYVLAVSLVVFFSMAAMSGLNTLVCRYLAESFAVGDARRAGTAIQLVLPLAVASVSGVGALAWLAARFLAEPLFHVSQLRESAGLVALWVMLLAASQILAETCRGLHDLAAASIVGGVSGGLSCSAVFLAGAATVSLFTAIDLDVVLRLAIVSLAVSIVFATARVRHMWPRPAIARSSGDPRLEPLTHRSVLRDALPIVLVQLFGYGLAQLDIWLVGMYCSTDQLAVYGVVRRVSLLVAIPLTQVSLVVASSICELNAQGDLRGLERVLRRAATLSAAITLVPLVLLLIFAAPLLDIAFGPTFRAGAGPLRVLCLGQLIFAITGPCGATLMMTGRQRMSLGALLASAPLYALAPWAAVHVGLVGMAVVSTLAMATHNLIQWVAVNRSLRIKTHPFLTPSYITSG